MVEKWGPSLNERMVQTKGRSSGFDYMRILLACAVIVWHSFGVSYGLDFTHNVENGPLRPVVMVILPCFFGLSGFLVAGSLVRNSKISTFLGLRVIRIFPALAVESLLSAWLLGPLLTTVPLNLYFQNPNFWAYHFNIIGDIHYNLPGVFEHNPIPRTVNAQLSTVPWELRCYIALILLSIVRLVNRPLIFFIIVICTSLAIFLLKIPHSFQTGFSHNNVGGINLVLSFLSAVALFQLRDFVPWSGRIALVSLLLLAAFFLIPGFEYLCGLPAAYLTIYLGLMNPTKIWLLRGADYSYGIYLYGFAIQQMIAQFGPWARHWYVNMPLSLAGAAIFAALSWHYVEKPALKLRKFLPKLEAIINNFHVLFRRLKARRVVEPN